MKTAATRSEYSGAETLMVAFELGWSKWKLASTVGFGQRARVKTISAGDVEAVEREIDRAKERFGVAFIGPGVDEFINLQRDGSKAKPYQVRQVRKVLLRSELRSDD